MTSDLKKPVDLNDKAILVTGGTGSFGQAFVQRVIETSMPRRLIVFSRDELKQYEMAKRFPEAKYPFMRYFIGDVRDLSRLEMAMRGVDIVVHAAAMKHVGAAEYNPFECIRTNVHGAENIVTASIKAGVKKVIALSTDKACSPINLYGASKLAADKIFVAGNHLSAMSPPFAVVRYGNVLGSRGSVLPFFRELIEKGTDHLPITDPRMTRFWITLRQGVDFVLSCLNLMQGGELFVPQIPSMKITDIASHLAPNLPLREVGIRPGEKLHEQMITVDDARNTIALSDRYIITPMLGEWNAASYNALGAAPVEEGFRYSSDTNTHWLDAAGLERMLAESHS